MRQGDGRRWRPPPVKFVNDHWISFFSFSPHDPNFFSSPSELFIREWHFCYDVTSLHPTRCHRFATLSPLSKWDASIHAFLTRADGCACASVCTWATLVCKGETLTRRAKELSRRSWMCYFGHTQGPLWTIGNITLQLAIRVWTRVYECRTGQAWHSHIAASCMSDHPDLITVNTLVFCVSSQK